MITSTRGVLGVHQTILYSTEGLKGGLELGPKNGSSVFGNGFSAVNYWRVLLVSRNWETLRLCFFILVPQNNALNVMCKHNIIIPVESIIPMLPLYQTLRLFFILVPQNNTVIIMCKYNYDII